MLNIKSINLKFDKICIKNQPLNVNKFTVNSGKVDF